MARYLRQMATLIVASALLTGCTEDAAAGKVPQGEGPSTTEATPSSTEATPSSSSTSTHSSSPTSQRSTSTSSSPETDTNAAPGRTGGNETGPPIVTGTSNAPQILTLEDFFIREGWKEGEVQVPRQEEPVQALTTDVRSPYSTKCEKQNGEPPSSPPLELRLAAESGTVSFTVSQALDSATSDTLLEVTLLADGRTVDTTTVPFAESRTLSVPVDGVSSVRLQIAVSGDSPSACSTAVVRDVQLTSG